MPQQQCFIQFLQRIRVIYESSINHISSLQGLSGIELGNSLILQVAQALKREISTLQQFVTLSPIPGFRKWLETHLRLCSVNPGKKKINHCLSHFVSQR